MNSIDSDFLNLPIDDLLALVGSPNKEISKAAKDSISFRFRVYKQYRDLLQGQRSWNEENSKIIQAWRERTKLEPQQEQEKKIRHVFGWILGFFFTFLSMFLVEKYGALSVAVAFFGGTLFQYYTNK